ncbi:HisA/HisF-related TIM barrel protein [Herbaspirillum chlorophenolicum]|uniref:HisA/HisF-related TIM barrel protein n=1 Tax=Herbaspirillum chlorophenolicum TaxID=211589 RepID=A0ABW8ES72_9BURK
MLKKRLIGVITVKNGRAVQSFGYRRYLPLGRPEVLAENLDRWGADEILLQCLDRSAAQAGPDYSLLERVARLGLGTPLIYAGGIATVDQGVEAVKLGADRICLDAVLHDLPAVVAGLREQLGAQALIASLPLVMEEGACRWVDYRDGSRKPLGAEVSALLQDKVVSEVMVIDYLNEGLPQGFDFRLIEQFGHPGVPLIAFGGLSDAAQLRRALELPRVVAGAIGNFLTYREHAVSHFKAQLAGLPLRAAS